MVVFESRWPCVRGRVVGTLAEIALPNTLENDERGYIHLVAGKMGLISKSYGCGATVTAFV